MKRFLPPARLASAAGLVAITVALACETTTITKSGGAPAQETSPTAPEDIGEVCKSLCARENLCFPEFELGACTADCEKMNSTAFLTLRDDLLPAAKACVQEAECKKFRWDNVLGDCMLRAAESIEPSEEAISFCDDLAKKLNECKLSSVHSDCVGRIKTYDDATIAATRSCMAGECLTASGCTLQFLWVGTPRPRSSNTPTGPTATGSGSGNPVPNCTSKYQCDSDDRCRCMQGGKAGLPCSSPAQCQVVCEICE